MKRSCETDLASANGSGEGSGSDALNKSGFKSVKPGLLSNDPKRPPFNLCAGASP
jgi:hypothetical protein